jgi:serine/threonine protein kinase
MFLDTSFRTSGAFARQIPENVLHDALDSEEVQVENRTFVVKRRPILRMGESEQVPPLSREFDVYVHLHACGVACLPPAAAYAVSRNTEILLVERCDAPLKPAELVERLHDVVAALETLHRHGVIHCDLKPEHIRTFERQVVLIDFDLACPVKIGGRAPFLDLVGYGAKFEDYLTVPSEILVGMSRGTPRFQSVNSLLGYKPSPCWDYESLAYVYVDLTKSATLPWVGEGRSQDYKIAQLLDPDHAPSKRQKDKEKPNTGKKTKDWDREGDEKNNHKRGEERREREEQSKNPEWLGKVFSAVREAAISAHTSLEETACKDLCKLLFALDEDIRSRNPSPTRAVVQQAKAKPSPVHARTHSYPLDGPVAKAAVKAARHLETESSDVGSSGTELERKILIPRLAKELELEKIDGKAETLAKNSPLSKFRSADKFEIDGVGQVMLDKFKKLLPLRTKPPSFLFTRETQSTPVHFVAEVVTVGSVKHPWTLCGKLAQLQWSLLVEMHMTTNTFPHPLMQGPNQGVWGAILVVGARKPKKGRKDVKWILNDLMESFGLAFPFLRVASVNGTLRQVLVDDESIVDTLRGRSETQSLFSGLQIALAGCLVAQFALPCCCVPRCVCF